MINNKNKRKKSVIKEIKKIKKLRKKMEKRVKFIIIGDKTVGKSCIINQFIEKQFINEYIPTIGSDKIKKEIEIEGKILNLEIWDTVGQEQYSAVNKIFIKNAQIALIVYDITNRKSFENLNNWYNLIFEINKDSNVIVGVTANKTDLYENQVVDSEEGKNFADEKKISFFETSAKDYESIENVFIQLSKFYINKVQKIVEEEIERRNSMGLIKDDKNNRDNIKKKKGCC
jgi:small GTP-binding protein